MAPGNHILIQSRSRPAGRTSLSARYRIYGGYLSQSNFGNSAITAGGATAGITINNNLLAGGGFTVYCEQEINVRQRGPPFTITNNRFSRIFVSTLGGFGPSRSCSDEIQSGNVYHETGQRLNLG